MVNMPNCGCFHQYELESTAPGEYQFTASVEGQADLKSVLESANLATSVSAGTSWFKTTIHLSGVTNGAALMNFCNQLKSAIIVDLTPSLDFCHALGPYTVIDENNEFCRTDMGELVFLAKYRNDPEAAEELASRLSRFIDNHPGFKNVTMIATPPSSNPSRPNLVESWAKQLAARMGWNILTATKTRLTPPQKEISEEDSEDDAKSRISSSMQVPTVRPGTEVLLLDDTIRSGGTLIELGRVLR